MDNASCTLIRKILSDAAGSTIYARGLHYARDGLAQVTADRWDDELLSLEGNVYGSEEYETSLLIDLRSEDLESYECSCPMKAFANMSWRSGLPILIRSRRTLRVAVFQLPLPTHLARAIYV